MSAGIFTSHIPPGGPPPPMAGTRRGRFDDDDDTAAEMKASGKFTQGYHGTKRNPKSKDASFPKYVGQIPLGASSSQASASFHRSTNPYGVYAPFGRISNKYKERYGWPIPEGGGWPNHPKLANILKATNNLRMERDAIDEELGEIDGETAPLLFAERHYPRRTSGRNLADPSPDPATIKLRSLLNRKTALENRRKEAEWALYEADDWLTRDYKFGDEDFKSGGVFSSFLDVFPTAREKSSREELEDAIAAQKLIVNVLQDKVDADAAKRIKINDDTVYMHQEEVITDLANAKAELKSLQRQLGDTYKHPRHREDILCDIQKQRQLIDDAQDLQRECRLKLKMPYDLGYWTRMYGGNVNVGTHPEFGPKILKAARDQSMEITLDAIECDELPAAEKLEGDARVKLDDLNKELAKALTQRKLLPKVSGGASSSQASAPKFSGSGKFKASGKGFIDRLSDPAGYQGCEGLIPPPPPFDPKKFRNAIKDESTMHWTSIAQQRGKIARDAHFALHGDETAAELHGRKVVAEEKIKLKPKS